MRTSFVKTKDCCSNSLLEEYDGHSKITRFSFEVPIFINTLLVITRSLHVPHLFQTHDLLEHTNGSAHIEFPQRSREYAPIDNK